MVQNPHSGTAGRVVVFASPASTKAATARQKGDPLTVQGRRNCSQSHPKVGQGWRKYAALRGAFVVSSGTATGTSGWILTIS